MSQKAARWLDKRRSVTGFLLPAEAPASSATQAWKKQPPLRSEPVCLAPLTGTNGPWKKYDNYFNRHSDRLPRLTVQKIVSPGRCRGLARRGLRCSAIALEFAFKGGAAQDPPGKSGAATLLAASSMKGAGPWIRRGFIARSTRMRSRSHFPPTAIISVDACKA